MYVACESRAHDAAAPADCKPLVIVEQEDTDEGGDTDSEGEESDKEESKPMIRV